MGKIIKKYFQYVKEDINPSKELTKTDLDFEEDEFPGPGNGEGIEDPTELEDATDAEPTDGFEDDGFEEEFDGEAEEVEEEEPGYEGGRMLVELAKKLGTKVVNNEINYNGQVITCFSEDDRFRIGDQIIGKNVDEAFKNLQAGKYSDTEDEFEGGEDLDGEEFVQESKKIKCNCCEDCSGNKGCKCDCKNCKCK